MTLMHNDGTIRSNATETLDGPIPHLRMLWNGQEIYAPVKVQRRSHRTMDSLPRPMRTPDGELIYALPMGAEIIP